MQFRLRTLVILVAIGPPVLAAVAWLAGFGDSAQPILLMAAGYICLVVALIVASWLMEAVDASTLDISENSAANGVTQEPTMHPNFTDEEQYLISFYKSRRESTLGELLGAELASIVAVLIMVGLAFSSDVASGLRPSRPAREWAERPIRRDIGGGLGGREW